MCKLFKYPERQLGIFFCAHLCYTIPMGGVERKTHFHNFGRAVTALLLSACLLFLCACTAGKRAASISYITEKYGVPVDKQLIVYTSHKEEVYLPIIREFENTTGISVEIHAGGTAELFKEVRDNPDAGICDIIFGGGIESYEAQKDLFLPYEAVDKDKLDKHYLSEDDSYTAFTELPLVFVYNTKLVSEEEAPRSWYDLFDPKWRGQIAFADIHTSGTSYTILSTLSQVTKESVRTLIPKFLNQLHGRVLDSSGRIIPGVSTGSFLIGITLEETAMKNINAGQDIAMIYPAEGTSALPDGCAIVKNAPHTYNAGKFIDFIINYDTQRYATDMFMRRPVRTDVSLPSSYAKIDQIEFDVKRAAGDEETYFELWDEYLSGEEE